MHLKLSEIVKRLLGCGLALILLLGATQVTSAQQQQNQQDDQGWVSLFDGKSLAGWKVSENSKSVFVENGELVVFGPRAHAFYVGKDGKADFTDFHLKVKVKTTRGSNSGIYFHTRYQEEGWPNKGYEAQVNNTQQDKRKTGSLYRIKDNLEAPVKDDEWFDYDVIVKGKRIVLKINGKQLVDYTEPGDLDRPERCLDHGTIALQAHDPKSKVFYKDIKIKRLKKEDQPFK